MEPFAPGGNAAPSKTATTLLAEEGFFYQKRPRILERFAFTVIPFLRRALSPFCLRLGFHPRPPSLL